MQTALGWAIPNVAVTYYTQPSLVLATVYNDANGDAAISNPQMTDGYGHAVAYLDVGEYTVTYSGPQIQTATFPDQVVGGPGGVDLTFFSGTPTGPQDGVNRVFTLTNNGTPLSIPPDQADVWQNFPLVPGVGYALSGVTIVYTAAPATTDTLWAQGYTAT